jgi:hypothetical protein
MDNAYHVTYQITSFVPPVYASYLDFSSHICIASLQPICMHPNNKMTFILYLSFTDWHRRRISSTPPPSSAPLSSHSPKTISTHSSLPNTLWSERPSSSTSAQPLEQVFPSARTKANDTKENSPDPLMRCKKWSAYFCSLVDAALIAVYDAENDSSPRTSDTVDVISV